MKSTEQRRLIDVKDLRPCRVTFEVNLQFLSANDSLRLKCSRDRSDTLRSRVISNVSVSRLRWRRNAFSWSPFFTKVKAKGMCRQRNSRVMSFSSLPNRYVLGRMKVNKLKKAEGTRDSTRHRSAERSVYFVLNLSSKETKRVKWAIQFDVIVELWSEGSEGWSQSSAPDFYCACRSRWLSLCSISICSQTRLPVKHRIWSIDSRWSIIDRRQKIRSWSLTRRSIIFVLFYLFSFTAEHGSFVVIEAHLLHALATCRRKASQGPRSPSPSQRATNNDLSGKDILLIGCVNKSSSTFFGNELLKHLSRKKRALDI